MYIFGADIGGTQARLALANASSSGWEICQQQIYKTCDFSTITHLLTQFLSDLPQPESAVLAVAGPINKTSNDTQASLTNVNWTMSRHSLQQDMQIPKVELINDFAAIAYALPVLKADKLIPLKPGQTDPNAPQALLGAGTGLGQAAVIPNDHASMVLASEGGHTDFSPRTPDQEQVYRYLANQYHHVSVERVLSGPGLENIYQALKTPDDPVLTAADITNSGIQVNNKTASRTLNTFASIYGAQAGNVALHYMAEGGVYLAGGVSSKLASYLPQSKFIECFLDKGRFGDYLERIPVHIINDELAGLTGTLQRAWSSPEITTL